MKFFCSNILTDPFSKCFFMVTKYLSLNHLELPVNVWYHQGNVGINIERPEHATLAVGGNVLVSGSVNHYSDQRVKENIQVCSPFTARLNTRL